MRYYLNHLPNFPFATVDELHDAFDKGQAEPLVPEKIAIDYTTKVSRNPTPNILRIASGVFLIVAVFLTFKYDAVKWWHALLFFCLASGSVLGKKMQGIWFIVMVGLLIYWTTKDIAFLFVGGAILLGAIAHYAAIQISFSVTVKEILINGEMVENLWMRNAMYIRFANGKLVHVDGEIIR